MPPPITHRYASAETHRRVAYWRSVRPGHWRAVDRRGVLLAEAVEHEQDGRRGWRFWQAGSGHGHFVKTLREAKSALQFCLNGLR